MDLTIYDLKNMSNSLDNLSKLIKDILKTKYPDKSFDTFKNVACMEASKEDVKTNPQNYYKVQCYNRMCYIVFDRSSRVYHIVTKGFYPPNLPKSYRLYRNTKYSFIISNSLEKTLEVFHQVCLDCINPMCPQNELF